MVNSIFLIPNNEVNCNSLADAYIYDNPCCEDNRPTIVRNYMSNPALFLLVWNDLMCEDADYEN